MSRGTQNTLVLLVGLSALLMAIKGTYLHFVKPSLLPWLIAAGVVLVVLAVASIVRDLRDAPDGSDADEHGHRPWLVWLLLLPIALTTFVVPPPLGAQGAAPEAVAATAPPKRAFPPLPAGRAPAVSIPDAVMRAAADSTNSLDRRLITLAGFTVKYPDGTDLGRVVIVCCAADAQLARIHLSGAAAAEAAGYPEDTWLQVEGTVVPGTSTASTNFVPTFSVSRVTRIDKPANTYAY
ncbi:putative membrane protein [Mycobacterium sp. OAS707]|uniref:TIGR03943 family putative permease subunit n=1 Tax=Mycobacterium sp. OAS707 TaxID=2663822 RepID=UPI001789CA02|nr:TIGR03943 family protein [Mycobacterium sp. OAS707]MBE1550066.1 putative membrane protein [Mycobacterium sp. OAS707]